MTSLMRISNVYQIALAAVLFSSAAFGDDLPRELLLQCEGNSKLFEMLGDTTTDIKFDTFKVLQLRLKDRAIVNIENNIVNGKDCKLQDGTIACELIEALYDAQTNSTEKRHFRVLLTRQTGEAMLYFETWTFHGKTTAGKPFLSTRVQKTGICRTIGQPLF
jgi:hypothetical protein